jgi:LuxR family transcriptional regulator, maltose regulon positive regulatory protein
MTDEGREAPILESKLYPATGTRRPLPRPRLETLSDVLDGSYPVVLVAAPAGYGKSTLMARWHASLVERGIPCAWLSLDEDDNDKVRFMRHLLAALQKADARLGRALSRNLTTDFPGGAKALLQKLADDLASLRERVVLFLDDLHFVHEPEVLEIVDWLVNYAPRVLQQVIGSRETRHLRLGSLRVRRQLFELESPKLQFDLEEASRFYSSRLGRELPLEDLRRLVDKTEGWPAALELAGLALAGLPEQAAFIEEFAGTDAGIVDYLGEAVLSRMDERTRTFVFRISMFDRISAPLARAVAGTDDADDLLHALRLQNLFLIPLDGSATWVRFHHLVGEFFREHYRRTAPAQARECLLRGAHWLHANGYVEEAVNSMIRAQDWDQATRWVAASVEELVFRRGYHQTIMRWMHALPEVWVDRHPVIRIQYAFALSFYSRDREYEAQIYRLQQLLQSLEEQPQRDAHVIDELRCAVELQTALSTGLRDEGKRGGELAGAWLAKWPDASLRRKGVMGNVLAFGHKSTGEIARGFEVLAETRRWLSQGEGYYALAWTNYLEALLHMKRGSYLEARLACSNGLGLVARELQDYPTHASSLLHAVFAAIAYEFEDVDQAAEHIERAMDDVNEGGHADAMILTYLTQARLQRLRHDEGGAVAVLRDGQELGERRGLRRVTLALAAEECTGLARSGRHEDARLVAARFGFNELPDPARESDLVTDKALRAASRYLLEQAPKLVVQALTRAIDSCQRRGLAHRLVELLLLRTLAHQRDGEEASALADLQRALTIAAPRQYLRVFLDEGRELRPLIERLDPQRLRGSEAAPLASQLQQAMREPGGRSDNPASRALGEALTRREVSILKRLESDLSNKEIAEAIFISEGTLKWHLHNIYSKLDVKNRSGALLRARALSIL